jgi:D-alanyl-D-alanine carboxypeptidase (penicillin-binding protein 5/6)
MNHDPPDDALDADQQGGGWRERWERLPWTRHALPGAIAGGVTFVVLGAALLIAGVGHAGGSPRKAPPAAAPTVPARPQIVSRLPAAVTFAGARPQLAWPVSGQAAMAVRGTGSLGTSGPAGTPQPTASIAKVMTAYVILADHPLAAGEDGPTLTVDAAEADEYPAEQAASESLVPVAEGEQLTERQALEALLLPSADNVAQILARWDAGSTRAFLRKMNATAASLQMTNTRYTDPSGYEASTVSTAADLVKLGEAAMHDATFEQIVGESAAVVPVAGTVHNTDTLLGSDGVIGIKTGSTTYAGGCLLFAADTTVGGRKSVIYGAVLGQPGDLSTLLPNVMNASDQLISSAANTLTARRVVKAGQPVADIKWPGKPWSQLTSPRDVTVVGWPGLSYHLAVTAQAGQGTLTVTNGNSGQAKPITLTASVHQGG